MSRLTFLALVGAACLLALVVVGWPAGESTSPSAPAQTLSSEPELEVELSDSTARISFPRALRAAAIGQLDVTSGSGRRTIRIATGLRVDLKKQPGTAVDLGRQFESAVRRCEPRAVKATLRADGPSGRREIAVGWSTARAQPGCASAERLPTAPVKWTTSARHPVDPAQFVAFGSRSHWLQPWRAYEETPTIARLRSSIGINFNVDAKKAARAARALARSGFTRARVEVPWNAVAYDAPLRFADEGSLRTRLTALRAAGIRPVLLLNANQGGPGPSKPVDLATTSAASAGARTVTLARTVVPQVVRGLTGFNSVDNDDSRRPDVLITAVDSAGRATLSRPLPGPLAAGPHEGTTLRYAPFAPPLQSDGARNSQFEATLQGWLRYVRLVTIEARSIFGTHFDLEIWNELSFGSDFLDASNYYNPAPPGKGDVTAQLLSRTVAFLRQPALGLSGVGISDGFASQTPFAAARTSPAGLTALSKHPYPPTRTFPTADRDAPSTPLDALGEAEGPGHGNVRSFTPSYRAFFPEYFLTAIQTEALTRDLAPTTSLINGVPHGRRVSRSGKPAPEIWITETGIDPASADLGRPIRQRARGTLDASLQRLKAKSSLRSVVAFVNKGAHMVDLYAADGPLALVSPSLYRGGSAGAVLTTFQRFTAALDASRSAPGPARPLHLDEVADVRGDKQFEGDGTPAHPDLFNRDVFAFFPFQSGGTSWAVPYYVMTRDLRHEQRGRTGARRFDISPAPYRLKVTGVRGPLVEATSYDPLDGKFTPVRVLSRQVDGCTIEVMATDSPRVLTLKEGR